MSRTYAIEIDDRTYWGGLTLEQARARARCILGLPQDATARSSLPLNRGGFLEHFKGPLVERPFGRGMDPGDVVTVIPDDFDFRRDR